MKFDSSWHQLVQNEKKKALIRLPYFISFYHISVLLRNNDIRGIVMSPWCCCSHVGDTVVTNTDMSTRHLGTVTTFISGGKLGLSTI